MSIQLIALDIDGTLTNDPFSKVSPENLQAIRRAQQKGVYVTIATGRGCCASKMLWRALDVQGPGIHYGGAWIVDCRTSETLLVHPMDPELVYEVLEYAHARGIYAQLYQGDAVIYESPHPSFTQRYASKHGIPHYADPQIRQKRYNDVPKVLLYVDPEVEDAARLECAEYFAGRAAVSRSVPGFIEINALSATKGQALKWLAERMGLSPAEVAAVGDNYLDLDMIEWAGHGVCVANGAEQVKAAADILVPSCDENGVAYYIERYVL